MLDTAFQGSAEAWLAATGEPASYRSATTGLATPVTATLEREHSTVDDMGMVTQGMVATVLSSAIPAPARGDTITFPARVVVVAELLDDTGYLTRLMVNEQ